MKILPEAIQNKVGQRKICGGLKMISFWLVCKEALRNSATLMLLR